MNWYDDPLFDGESETVSGHDVRGDDWRRLQELRERSGKVVQLIKVAGTTFRLAAVPKGRDVTIVSEPENKFDSNAKRVEVDGEHVGYIPRGGRVIEGPVSLFKAGMTPYPHVWVCIHA